jgi:glycine cleavage system H protein
VAVVVVVSAVPATTATEAHGAQRAPCDKKTGLGRFFSWARKTSALRCDSFNHQGAVMIRFSEEHVWVRVEGDIGVVGITAHAQDTLGDIVFVELPAVGRPLAAGDVAGVVESVKAAADVYNPVSGTVTEVNEALREDPALANSAPLDTGWFYKLRLAKPAELEGLMDEDNYASSLMT